MGEPPHDAETCGARGMSDARKRYIAERLATAWNAKNPPGTVVTWIADDDGNLDDYRETVITEPARVGPGGEVAIVRISDNRIPIRLSRIYGVAKLQADIEARIAREGVA